MGKGKRWSPEEKMAIVLEGLKGPHPPRLSGQNHAAYPQPLSKHQTVIEEAKPISPKWAALIAKIFGEIPTICPRCTNPMDLKEFIFDDISILKFFPYIPRAPPKIKLEDYIPHDNINICPQ